MSSTLSLASAPLVLKLFHQFLPPEVFLEPPGSVAFKVNSIVSCLICNALVIVVEAMTGHRSNSQWVIPSSVQKALNLPSEGDLFPLPSVFGCLLHLPSGPQCFPSGIVLAAPAGPLEHATEAGRVERAECSSVSRSQVEPDPRSPSLGDKTDQKTCGAELSKIYIYPIQGVKQGAVVEIVCSASDATSLYRDSQFLKLSEKEWIVLDPSVYLSAVMELLKYYSGG